MHSQEIGNRIAGIRKSKKMSKEQFAKFIGMSGSYLGTLEQGNSYISSDKLISLCEKTGVSADYILFGEKSLFVKNIEKFLSEQDESEMRKAFDIMKNLSNLINDAKIS